MDEKLKELKSVITRLYNSSKHTGQTYELTTEALDICDEISYAVPQRMKDKIAFRVSK